MASFNLRFSLASCVCVAFSSSSYGFIPSVEEQERYYAEVMYASIMERKIADAVRERPVGWCNYFGYRVRCRFIGMDEASLHALTAAVAAEVTEMTSGQAAQAAADRRKAPLADSPGLVSPELVGFAGAYPGYVPNLSYAGQGNYDYENAEAQGEALYYEEFPYFMLSESSAFSLEELRFLSSDPSALKDLWDIYGEIWFPAFVPSSMIIDASKILAFWQSYVSYSEALDPAECGGSCELAFDVVLPAYDASGIVRCRVEEAFGEFGAPEDCEVIVLQKDATTYVRAAVNWLGPDDFEYGGPNDISCAVKDDATELVRKLTSAMESLNSGGDKKYNIKSDIYNFNADVIVTSSYERSSFLDVYEVSTIRLMADFERADTLSVAATILVSETEQHSVDAYRGVSRTERARVVEKIYSLLPKEYDCRIEGR